MSDDLDLNKEAEESGNNSSPSLQPENEKAKEIRQEEKQTAFDKIYDWLEVIAVSAAIVILALTFVFRISHVDGISMNETLLDGDLLVIQNNYMPKGGDIVVVQQLNSFFEYPLVKRVIATGGQTLKIDFTNWKVWVDGVLFNEDYVNFEQGKIMKYDDFLSIYSGTITKNGNSYEMTIPDGYLFVMGDNRNHSSDSRSGLVGLVRENEVLGKVVFRMMPLNRIGAVK